MAHVNAHDNLENILEFRYPGRQKYINPDEHTLSSIGADAPKRRHRKRRRPLTPAERAKRAREMLHHFGGKTPAEVAEAIKKLKSARRLKRLARLAMRKKLRLAARAKRLKMLADAAAKSPAIRKRMKLLRLRQRLNRASAEASQSQPYGVPMVSKPSADPTAMPVQPPVDDDHDPPTPAEEVERAEDDATEENFQEAAEDQQEAVEEGEEEAAEENEEEAAEDENASMTEASDSEEAQDDEAAGIGYDMTGAVKAAKRIAHATKVRTHARPLAHKIQKRTRGKVKAKKVLTGCKLLQAARGGDKKAKLAVATLQKKAAGGDPAAKKAVLQLKLCHKVLRKARKSVLRASGIVPAGLSSKSAVQRGYAMIPSVAQRMFGIR